jgi:hypothetical protein
MGTSEQLLLGKYFLERHTSAVSCTQLFIEIVVLGVIVCYLFAIGIWSSASSIELHAMIPHILCMPAFWIENHLL